MTNFPASQHERSSIALPPSTEHINLPSVRWYHTSLNPNSSWISQQRLPSRTSSVHQINLVCSTTGLLGVLFLANSCTHSGILHRVSISRAVICSPINRLQGSVTFSKKSESGVYLGEQNLSGCASPGQLLERLLFPPHLFCHHLSRQSAELQERYPVRRRFPFVF